MPEIEMLVDRKRVKVQVEPDGDKIRFKFGFNRSLINEIKCMQGARWSPEKKQWSVNASRRNLFQLEYLCGKNPYKWFDRPLGDFPFSRPLYEHQKHLASHALTYHYVIMAAEMGTGKSLSSIEVMELSGHDDWWYVGPRSAIESYKYELMKWRSKVIPTIFTYEELKKAIENWQAGKKAPRGLILDEASRCKNPTAQRSQAAFQVAEGVRQDWGMDGYVIEMSGSPAPKSPADWYHLCEIAWPGYIREGDINKFRNRLAVTVQKESIAGGTYPELVTWRDDENKCQICGQFPEHQNHDQAAAMTMGDGTWHSYVKGKNEIAFLYERMKGLVVVKFKKDCLDLPEKQYRQIILKPTKSIEQAAKILSAKARTTIEGLTNLRELSDGFQYKEKVIGKKDCPACNGTKTIRKWMAKEGVEMVEPDHPDFLARKDAGDYYEDIGPCDYCSGTGQINDIARETVEVPTPKEDALAGLLDEHSDVGRLVIYAGFTGSIDRVVKICHKFGWVTIRVDGRGWHCLDTNGSAITPDMLPEVKMGSPFLQLFQDLKEKYPLVAFVGHPGSAGMGLTLTASPSIVYWSNDFNAESRIQSEDRIHRAGMDVNRGATIIDLLHLPSDTLVLNNLQKKRDLQALSLGEMQRVIDESANAARAF
jgi:hypothetical protein